LPRNPITVAVDDDGDDVYDAKTLGVDDVDATGSDFVVNYNHGLIRNLDHAALGATHKLKVTYKKEVQVLTEDNDANSQEVIRNIEGGSGKYTHIITDTQIETLEAAHDRAYAELSKYSQVNVSGSFKTDQAGYRSGQTIVINLPTWGYTSQEFVIQEVVSVLKSSNEIWYTVVFAGKIKTLTEFLKKLNLNWIKAEMGVGFNETLHDLLRLPSVEIEISDATPTTFEERDNDFKWGVDAKSGKWNEAEWR